LSRNYDLKKIILLNNNPPFAGVGRYAYALYQHLAKSGLKVIFISWDRELFNLFYKASRALRVSWFYYLLKFKYLSAKLNVNAPLIHVANAGYLASVVPLLRKKSSALIVITVHDLIPFVEPRSIADFYMRNKMLFVTNADYIICVSESTKRDLLRFIDVDPKKVRVVYHGVDHELFKPRDKLEARRKLRLPLDKPMFLNVGSEEPRKNIPTLIKAFGILVRDVPNAMLIRVGSPTNITKKLIHNQGLEGKIVYLRPTDEDLSLLYNASDVFVFPSYYEGLGLPLLEAMASRCPVVAGNRSAIPEAVGNAGILLDPFDVDGFAYWMCEVLTNEDLRNRLSETGYRRSMSFSWEKCARETLEVYREVLNEV
jgi:glycosyltransferase involved in cell wall biosynthesis